MANPLFNLLNNNVNFGQFGNMMNLVSQFNQFKQGFQGNAEQQVHDLINSGQMTQEQFNQLAPLATQFQNMMKNMFR